jgi:DtxR family Mn-dependent transcriptional regulator
VKLSDRAEEILEKLWIELVADKKKSCDVAILKDDEAFNALQSLGLVDVVATKATLTEKGTEEARDCVRRHRLAERLLSDVLAVKKPLIHGVGCAFEHLLHKGLDENVCTLLGHPRFCPHGRPIPEGRCCKEARQLADKAVLPLSDLRVNQKAQVAYLHTHDGETLPKLMAIGLLPGSDITLLQRFPTFVFQMGESQFAIDGALASHVYVRASKETRAGRGAR